MYETDLTDFQWQVIQEVLPDTRRRKYSLRVIVNALLYLTKRLPVALADQRFPTLCKFYLVFTRKSLP